MTREGWFSSPSHDQVMLFGSFPAWASVLASTLPFDLLPDEVHSVPPASRCLSQLQGSTSKQSSLRTLQGGIDQVTVNRYQAGGHLKPHTDLPRFKDGIFILSLESSACMQFNRAKEHCECLLAPGDLLYLQGTARLAQHKVNLQSLPAICKRTWQFS